MTLTGSPDPRNLGFILGLRHPWRNLFGVPQAAAPGSQWATSPFLTSDWYLLAAHSLLYPQGLEHTPGASPDSPPPGRGSGLYPS